MYIVTERIFLVNNLGNKANQIQNEESRLKIAPRINICFDLHKKIIYNNTKKLVRQGTKKHEFYHTPG
jgi:hypothetical protein